MQVNIDDAYPKKYPGRVWTYTLFEYIILTLAGFYLK